MIKILLLLFLLSTQIFALDHIKIKAKQTNDIVKVKCLIPHPMINPRLAEVYTGKKENIHFITHITAKVNGYIVYDASTSFNLAKDPLIEFNYTYEGRGDVLSIVAVDNKNEIFQGKTKIKDSLGTNKRLHSKLQNIQIIDHRKLNPKVWKAKSIENAVVALYGSVEPLERHITIEAKKKEEETYMLEDGVCIGGGWELPIYIQSDINITSFILLQDVNDYSATAVFDTTLGQKINYRVNTRLKKTGNIVVVAKGSDGLFYTARQKVYVINASHTDCYGDNVLD